MRKHGLDKDPALGLLARIVNGAGADNSLWHQTESAGLEAIAEGFRHLGFKSDLAHNQAEWVVYDSLYAYCQELVRRGSPTVSFAESPSLAKAFAFGSESV